METITFNDVEYPVRYWNDYKISVSSLADELEKAKYKGKAGYIDDTIYYYVNDEEINLSEKEFSTLLFNNRLLIRENKI